jgi:ABC-type bacteriocin/lantibiotic exporter with double-glycine peptidase domain
MSAFHEEEFDKKKVEWNTWKTLLKFAFKYKKALAIMFAAITVVSLTEVFMPLLTSYAIDHYITPGNVDGLWKFVLVYIGAILATGITVATFIYHTGIIETHVTHDIRARPCLGWILHGSIAYRHASFKCKARTYSICANAIFSCNIILLSTEDIAPPKVSA